MPANAGIHVFFWLPVKSWIPAFAGMTAVRSYAIPLLRVNLDCFAFGSQ